VCFEYGLSDDEEADVSTGFVLEEWLPSFAIIGLLSTDVDNGGDLSSPVAVVVVDDGLLSDRLED